MSRPGSPYAGAPFSYLDTGTAAPLGIVELMPGARNLMDYLQLSRDERLLVIAEHTVDPVVVQALAAAAAYRNADVHVLFTPPFSAGGWDREVPAPFLTAAHAEADAVVSCVWWGEVHSAPLFFTEVAKRRARFVSLHMTATAAMLATGGRFPPQLFYVIEGKALERLRRGSRLRVTTAQGTDVAFDEITWMPDSGPMRPGMWRPFPLGGVNFYPGRTDGVLVIEDSTATGVREEPLRVELADNLVRSIEGGIAADQLRAYAPGGYYLRHALLGLNPKVRIAGATQFEREKHAGAFYCGIDGLEEGRPNPARPGFAHCDCQLDRPTITLDGEPLVEGGRLLLLEDPEVRQAAARFGPPEVLLDPNPIMVLPRRYTMAS
jgi:2,5-dihydroxypyridine 5,6-dioxygenase